MSIKEDLSPLNSWFRQMGGSSHLTSLNLKRYDTEINSLKLPLIRTNTNLTTNKHLKKLKNKKTKLNLDGNNSSSASISNMLSESNMITYPSNAFFTKCIEDVVKSNHPNKLIFNEPRELKYVHSLPYLKYVTYGSGKCSDCKWKIDMFKIK
jgi:hypothetical protein